MAAHDTDRRPTNNINLLILLVVVLTCSVPKSTFAAPATIRLGEVDPLTGKLAKHGVEIHEGILYAVAERNARGGLQGHPVELICRDDQSRPEIAINQTEELLYRFRVVGLVGGYVDSLVGPVSELAAKHHTPYVASASLQRSLTLGRRNPYFFRVSQLGGIVDPLCEFVKQVLQPKRVAILYTATPGSTEFAQEVRERLQKSGVQIPIVEKFRSGCPDFSAVLLKIRQARVDLLICGGFFPDHLLLVRQLKELRIPLHAYLAPWGVAYPSFIETLGTASEHLFGMCAWSPGITLPETASQSRAFEHGFRKRFGKTPNTTTMHGYTSACALLQAIDNALKAGKPLSGDAIAEQLRSLDLPLPMERLAFDGNGDPRYYQQVIVQIQNGRLVAVYPPDRATGTADLSGGL